MKTLFFIFLILTSTNLFGFELDPAKADCDQTVTYQKYKVCYSNSHRQAIWTAHWLRKENLDGRATRKNDYRADRKMKFYVKGTDYKNSGFDRGHLVPAGDMKVNDRVMSESFYMSNMSPQRAEFNRRIWRSLEEHIRFMAKDFGDAFVVTAPVLESDLPKIRSGVSVPDFYYKIAYFPKKQIMRAYLMENVGHYDYDYRDHKITVDELEKITGIDFFSSLPDKLEKKLESRL